MVDGRPFAVADAVALAFAAHEGQVDKAGHPYVDHVLRVMLRVHGEETRMTAVLHDVLEDSEITVVDLYERGCPVEVVSAVVALTKRPGEQLEAYLGRVAADPLAVTVKRADLADNCDPERLARLSEEEAQRLRAKYARSFELLDRLTAPGSAAEPAAESGPAPAAAAPRPDSAPAAASGSAPAVAVPRPAPAPEPASAHRLVSGETQRS
jgi:hypothetical protein